MGSTNVFISNIEMTSVLRKGHMWAPPISCATMILIWKKKRKYLARSTDLQLESASKMNLQNLIITQDDITTRSSTRRWRFPYSIHYCHSKRRLRFPYSIHFLKDFKDARYRSGGVQVWESIQSACSFFCFHFISCFSFYFLFLFLNEIQINFLIDSLLGCIKGGGLSRLKVSIQLAGVHISPSLPSISQVGKSKGPSQ